MQKLLLTIDKISTFTGRYFPGSSWRLPYSSPMRFTRVYALDAPHSWAFDLMLQIMYGILFMMAGAYTLSKKGHVRGDVLYGFLPERVPATSDLSYCSSHFFLRRGNCAHLGAATSIDAGESWVMLGAAQRITADGRRLYHFKTLHPPIAAGGILFCLQGIVEIVRCGPMPKKRQGGPRAQRTSRRSMVEKLKEMFHVKTKISPNSE